MQHLNPYIEDTSLPPSYYERPDNDGSREEIAREELSHFEAFDSALTDANDSELFAKVARCAYMARLGLNHAAKSLADEVFERLVAARSAR